MAGALLFKNVLEIGPAEEPNEHHFGPICVPIPGDEDRVILRMNRNLPESLIIKILAMIIDHSDKANVRTELFHQPVPINKPMLTEEEVAAQLRCSVARVQRLCRNGDLSFTYENAVRIYAPSLEAYINGKKVPTSVPARSAIEAQQQEFDPEISAARARARKDVLLQRLHGPQKRARLTEEEKQRRADEAKKRERARESRAKNLERAKAAKAAKSTDQPKTS